MNIPQAPRMESIFDGRTDDVYARVEQIGDGGDKKPLHIFNKTPLDFAETTSTTLSTTTELAMQINEVFKPLFSDWHGSDVFIDGNGRLVVNFVFRAISDGKDETRAFLPINQTLETSKNQTLNRITQINAMNDSRSKRMALTEYGAEMAYDVMNNGIRHNMNPFKPETMVKQTSEIYEQAAYNAIQNIYCTIFGIDINKVLEILFGPTDENGERNVYGINPKRPVMAGQNVGGRTNYIIEIQKMTMRKYNEAMTKLGVIPVNGNITAVTETMTSSRRVR